MKRIKRTKEELRQKKEKPDRPLTEKDLEALLEHFGQTKNLPK